MTVPSPTSRGLVRGDADADNETAALRARLDLLQQENASLRDQLLQTQRLATIGTISAVIAHEFNNILTPVVSYAQIALHSAEGQTPDLPLIRKALSKSFAGATKAGRICASMLGLARGESETGAVLVQSVIDETLGVLARDPQKDGIALRVQVAAGLTIRADAVQLEQVLLNLLINAKQAMCGRNGSITIKATPADDGRHARVSVMDTGEGIAPQHLQKIFEPFFTTKATARRGEPRGTGLGLAICREIIQRHGGQIDVQSEQGKGTAFHLLLPLAVGSSAVAA